MFSLPADVWKGDVCFLSPRMFGKVMYVFSPLARADRVSVFSIHGKIISRITNDSLVSDTAARLHCNDNGTSFTTHLLRLRMKGVACRLHLI